MKKLLAAAALLLTMAGTASAYTIHYGFTADGNNYTSPYTNVTVESFEPGGAAQFGWSGDYHIINSSIPNIAAAPNGLSTQDTTWYISTPALLGGGNDFVTTAILDGPYNYLGLWWGSVDSYNSIKFFNDGVYNGTTISGSQAINPSSANGNQTAPSTNLYVNILDLPDFDQFQLISTKYAFEADNIAVAMNPVPEPGTMLLLGAGFLGLAIYGKRRKNA